MRDPMEQAVQGGEEIDEGLRLVARLGTADCDIVLAHTELPDGTFVPLHSHGDVECIHARTGSLDVYRGDRGGWFTVPAGASILVPPDVPHAIRNVSGRPVDAFAMMTVRLARFLGELGAIAAAAGRERPREERMRSLREVADRYGYWLASPEETAAIRGLPVLG